MQIVSSHLAREGWPGHPSSNIRRGAAMQPIVCCVGTSNIYFKKKLYKFLLIVLKLYQVIVKLDVK